jgi:hypothetical protein
MTAHRAALPRGRCVLQWLADNRARRVASSMGGGHGRGDDRDPVEKRGRSQSGLDGVQLGHQFRK